MKINDKNVFLLGDFNIEPLIFDSSEHKNKFINDSSPNCLHPQILIPTRVSGNSKAIIDNIFTNIAEPLIKGFTTGNITLVYLIIFHSFSFCLISFLIVLATREMLQI